MSYEKRDRHEPSEAQAEDDKQPQEPETAPAFPPRGTALSVLWLAPADADSIEERARTQAADRASARR